MNQTKVTDAQIEFELKEKVEEFERSDIELDEAPPEVIFFRLQYRQRQYDLLCNRLNW